MGVAVTVGVAVVDAIKPLTLYLLLTGCSTVTYTHGNTTITSTNFAITRVIGHVEISDETGHAVMDAAQTDEVAAINAAVKGVIQGIAAGVKP